MKKINDTVLRSTFAIVLGLVLILWPEAAINYLVIIIGVLFLIPGILSLINYFSAQGKDAPNTRSFPIEGAGSILFGLWLIIMPTFFVNILMYILGALLILAGILQIQSLIKARKWTTVSLGYYIVPALILIAGIVVLGNPFGVIANTFIFLGAVSLLYGISELFNWYKFKRQTT